MEIIKLLHGRETESKITGLDGRQHADFAARYRSKKMTYFSVQEDCVNICRRKRRTQQQALMVASHTPRSAAFNRLHSRGHVTCTRQGFARSFEKCRHQSAPRHRGDGAFLVLDSWYIALFFSASLLVVYNMPIIYIYTTLESR